MAFFTDHQFVPVSCNLLTLYFCFFLGFHTLAKIPHFHGACFGPCKTSHFHFLRSPYHLNLKAGVDLLIVIEREGERRGSRWSTKVLQLPEDKALLKDLYM